MASRPLPRSSLFGDDLAVLLKSFPRYRLASAQAYDMFPQTNHVETVLVLER